MAQDPASASAERGTRMLHTMVRVRDLERSIAFYVDRLGMRLLRLQHFPDSKFTLAFVGYDDESRSTAIELTHNWGDHNYEIGTAFGHIAIGVSDVAETVRILAQEGVRVVRPAGPLKGSPSELIAFVEDPDGYRIELIQRPVLGRAIAQA